MSPLQDAVILGPNIVSGPHGELVGGRYRLHEIIGRGAMKDVYRGVDERSQRSVAVARIVGLQEQMLDLRQEVELTRKVDNPNVARVYDFVEDNNVGYIVSELCEGPTLAQRLEAGPLPLWEALPIFVGLARGLEAIHAVHILHRDIKLENVVLRETATEVSVAILDFGISLVAKNDQTQVGVVRHTAGTFGYMPKEAIGGGPLDARSDVYALGICMHRLLTGRFPIDPGQYSTELEYLKACYDAEEHDVSGLPLERLLKRMLASRRDDRPFMPEVRAELEALFDVRPTPSRRTSTSIAFAPVARIPYDAALDPDAVLLSGWGWAPLVTVQRGMTTRVEARTTEGLLRWSADLDGAYHRGVTVDLDNDGVRELYLFGPDGLVSLDARGRRRFEKRIDAVSRGSTSYAIPHPTYPQLVIDGHAFTPDGSEIERMSRAYEGGGHALTRARDGRGLSYNGFADQAFRGAFWTPAAILSKRVESDFFVANLEASMKRAVTRLQLSVYGPGGKRVQREPVAQSAFPTGAPSAVEGPVLDDAHAPIAWQKNGTFIVVVPLVGDVHPFEPSVSAYCAPQRAPPVEMRGGQDVWRCDFRGRRRRRTTGASGWVAR